MIECAHLVVLADVSIVRECTRIAELMSNAEPYEIVKLAIEQHQKITRYLFIRSMILDGD